MKSRRGHVGLYCLLGTLACGLAIACKLAFVWGVDSYLYSLPVIGGVFASLEVAEIISPILLALLGLALGALTYYLPMETGLGLRLFLLGLALPLVLILGHRVRRTLWVQQVAAQGNLSLRQAQQVTNEFLQRETSQGGDLGFYWYTAARAKPPIRLDSLEMATEVDSLQNQLSDLGRRQTGLLGLAFSLYNWLFSNAGWGIRAAYALLSGSAGLSYFYKGQQWADRRRRP